MWVKLGGYRKYILNYLGKGVTLFHIVPADIVALPPSFGLGHTDKVTEGKQLIQFTVWLKKLRIIKATSSFLKTLRTNNFFHQKHVHCSLEINITMFISKLRILCYICMKLKWNIAHTVYTLQLSMSDLKLQHVSILYQVCMTYKSRLQSAYQRTLYTWMSAGQD